MDTVRRVALESIDFRYKSTENHPKVLILQGFYGSGRRSRGFESRHLDQKRKEVPQGTSFLFSFECIDLSPSNAKHLVERADQLNDGKQPHCIARLGSESRHLDQQKRNFCLPKVPFLSTPFVRC